MLGEDQELNERGFDMQLKEELIKAAHSMMFTNSGLQYALNVADPVAGLVLLDLIESAAKLQQRIESLSSAIEARQGE